MCRVDLLSSVTFCFFFQAEDGIRDLVRSRGLGDVYKRQGQRGQHVLRVGAVMVDHQKRRVVRIGQMRQYPLTCLLYTSDAADERSSVDLGGRRIIKKKKEHKNTESVNTKHT